MKRVNRVFILSIFLLFLSLPTANTLAQVQLLLLKGERVVLRLSPGDDFIFKIKGSKKKNTSYVSNISETAVYTHADTVPFHTIDRIYFKHSTFTSRSGSRVFLAGVLLFVLDQANELLAGHDLNIDSRVSIVSLSLAGAGLPMMLIKKKSQRLNRRYRLIMVEKGSGFYRE